jgi:predicted helicase
MTMTKSMTQSTAKSMTKFQKLLAKYSSQARTPREQGTLFEKLVIDFLLNDKVFSPQYSNVQTYQSWAVQHGKSAIDAGIDLVATNMNKFDANGLPTYTAIQCKNVSRNTEISKPEIDSFMGASDRDCFTNRMIFDTSIRGINSNALDQLNQSSRKFERVTLPHFENSSINWDIYFDSGKIVQIPKKELYDHQKEAINNIIAGLQKADRGKLIMACGTGKTFTALKIAEKLLIQQQGTATQQIQEVATISSQNKAVLFLVPSLSLMSQTITEWLCNKDVPISAFSVCSLVDKNLNIKRSSKADDTADTAPYDLSIPPTTKADELATAVAKCPQGNMIVVFATYQSIEVIEKAQKDYNMGVFDLIICDEAHRTTGAILANEAESNFVKVHDNNCIKGRKRLYMTATPRVYTDNAKSKAKSEDTELYCMDNNAWYGEVFYSLKFGEAVEAKLLSDYKVIILALDQDKIAVDLKAFLDNNPEIELPDATKMIGCYQALIKQNIDDGNYMHKVVAFCNTIEKSELFKNKFTAVIESYILANTDQAYLDCNVEHVSGAMSGDTRTSLLNWLKEDQANECRILSNVRCLSEGVDVPSLDAVMFIHGKKSKVDIVQSVGRVMRKATGKNMGYVIIPVVKPSNMSDSEVLSKNEHYQVVWDIVNALRSHDERLDSIINQVDLTDDDAEKYQILSKAIEVVVQVDKLPTAKKSGLEVGRQSNKKDDDNTNDANKIQELDGFQLDPVTKAIMAKIVERCGKRTYWEDWAHDVSTIAGIHISRIKATISDKNSHEYKVFSEFVSELQNNLNTSIQEDEVIEMLAQHIITRPVFNALFADYDFAMHNPVSQSMQSVLDILDQTNLQVEQKKLEKFYSSVQIRARGIKSAAARQKIILELYDNFFKSAFPRLAERLGIVYTPVECVDFIIRSVNDVLKQEFNQTLGDHNTHIIDPFTGTGTFITRLMQIGIEQGIFTREQLAYKYNLHEKTVTTRNSVTGQTSAEKICTTEIHANEIVLLAYYIASINIESVYHSIMAIAPNGSHSSYTPFAGICLTDTFQLNEEKEDMVGGLQLADNTHRRKMQRKLPIRVIIGNPPYSIGQKSGNDNNQNVKYEKLDSSIENTYIKHSKAGLSKGVYDSYIRAIRWASDRVDKYGVIGFITNAGWLDSNSTDGMRKCLKEEFSSIYVFNLRGNARTSGELRQKEKDNVFGQGTRTPIAITILVKNPDAIEHGKIYYYDIGDYLSREEKLTKISQLGSVANITHSRLWQEITPDQHHDWIAQRDNSFYEYIAIGDKKDKTGQSAIFSNFSLGLATNRDAWVYNYSKSKLITNVSGMIDFYNSELDRYNSSEYKSAQPSSLSDAEKYVAHFVNKDSKKIAWTADFFNSFVRQQYKQNTLSDLTIATYRPFNKIWCYNKKEIINRTYQLPKIFPEHDVENLVIGVTSLGAKKGFSAIISNTLVDLNYLEAGCQCFPLYLYEPITNQANNLLSDMDNTDATIITAPSGKQYKKTDAITDAGLKHFTDFYQDNMITKEDLFYYIYAILHNPQYKTKYANNLTKSLPHIPRVANISDFKAYVGAGRALAYLHINYEQVEPYNAKFEQDMHTLSSDDYAVVKMKFADKKDKSIIIYNSKITISHIPVRAYKYIVNGKSAIEWVMERQSILQDKDSGITNNANDWANETMNNPKYPLELLLRVITVSLKTLDIVDNLPELHI